MIQTMTARAATTRDLVTTCHGQPGGPPVAKTGPGSGR